MENRLLHDELGTYSEIPDIASRESQLARIRRVSMDKPTPRVSRPAWRGLTKQVNQALLGQFPDQIVRIVGKVTSLRGTEGTIDASGPVEVHLNSESNMREGKFVEIIGKIQSDLSVRTLTTINLEGNIDMSLVDQVIQLTHNHRELFY